MASKIGTAEFKNRLAALCLRGGGRGFPRKRRDQHILFKVDPEKTAGLFEAGTEEIDPVAVVEQAYRDAEERKREYLEKREGA